MCKIPPALEQAYCELNELRCQGKLVEYRDRSRQLLMKMRQQFGESSAEYTTAMKYLAHSYYELCDFDHSIYWCQEVLTAIRCQFGNHSKEVVQALNQLGLALILANRWDELEPILDEAVQKFQALPDDDRFRTYNPDANRLFIHLRRGDFASAHRGLDEGIRHLLRCLERASGTKSRWTDAELALLFDRKSLVYREEGKLRAAQRAIWIAMRIFNSRPGRKAAPEYARMWRYLGIIQANRRNLAGARKSLQLALCLRRRCRPPGHADITHVERELVRLDERETAVKAG